MLLTVRTSCLLRTIPFPTLLVVLVGHLLLSTAQSNELRPIHRPLQGLETAQTILLKASQTSSTGQPIETSHIQKIFSKRMGQLGYVVKTDERQNHEVSVHIDCKEQHWKDQNPQATDKHELSSITIHGPPCLFQYTIGGRPIPWQRIDRIVYNEGLKIVKTFPPTHSQSTAIANTTWYLESYDFPLLLAAEWGHIARLIRIFHHPETPLSRQRFIIILLGEVYAMEAFPLLVDTLKNTDLVETTARALGHFGERARPLLIELLQSSPRTEVQAAAAHGLGNIGALTGDTRSTPILLKFLKTPGMDLAVQTEIVWALGKSPDFSAFQALQDLEQRIWESPSKEPGMERLRQAVDWSIREVRQGGHTDDY